MCERRWTLIRIPDDGTMVLKVEKDGTVTVVSGLFSDGESHQAADDVLAFLEAKLGSPRQTSQLKQRPEHVHLQHGVHQHGQVKHGRL